MADKTGPSTSDQTSSNNNKRRRLLLLTTTNDEKFAELPLLVVISFLHPRQDYDVLLALAAVNKAGRTAVESAMERVYQQSILQKHAYDDTFIDRVHDRDPSSPGLIATTTTTTRGAQQQPAVPRPFRYLVRKAMDTHLYEITVTDEASTVGTGDFSIGMHALSPSEDRLAVAGYQGINSTGFIHIYDLSTKQRLCDPLMHDVMQGLFLLDDGRVISCCFSYIRIWTQANNGTWINRIGYSSQTYMICWKVYKQREIVFASTDESRETFEIKALDLHDGSVRDMFTINRAPEEEEFDPFRPDAAIDFFGDRWMWVNFVYDYGSNANVEGFFVYDLESLQRIQFLPGKFLPIPSSQSHSKVFYITHDEKFVRALELENDGRLTQVESFGMRLPDFTFVKEVFDNQLFMVGDGHSQSGLSVFDFATGRVVRTLGGRSCVVTATRNEILVLDRDTTGRGSIQIRAYCSDEPLY